MRLQERSTLRLQEETYCKKAPGWETQIQQSARRKPYDVCPLESQSVQSTGTLDWMRGAAAGLMSTITCHWDGDQWTVLGRNKVSDQVNDDGEQEATTAHLQCWTQPPQSSAPLHPATIQIRCMLQLFDESFVMTELYKVQTILVPLPAICAGARCPKGTRSMRVTKHAHHTGAHALSHL